MSNFLGTCGRCGITAHGNFLEDFTGSKITDSQLVLLFQIWVHAKEFLNSILFSAVCLCSPSL